MPQHQKPLRAGGEGGDGIRWVRAKGQEGRSRAGATPRYEADEAGRTQGPRWPWGVGCKQFGPGQWGTFLPATTPALSGCPYTSAKSPADMLSRPGAAPQRVTGGTGGRNEAVLCCAVKQPCWLLLGPAPNRPRGSVPLCGSSFMHRGSLHSSLTWHKVSWVHIWTLKAPQLVLHAQLVAAAVHPGVHRPLQAMQGWGRAG